MTPEEDTFSRLGEPAPEIDEEGNKFWYNEKGQLHRDNDLPAVISHTNHKFWYKNGIRHRDKGPAIVRPTGLTMVFKNGVRIR